MKAEIITEDDADTLIRATVRARTSAAVMAQGLSNGEVWLPLSQIEIVSDNGKRGSDNVTELLVPNWLVQKRALV